MSLPPAHQEDHYFAKLDHQIIQSWQEGEVYEQRLATRRDAPLFRFMDGPPFVNSASLHYGHLLVGVLKSSILWYQLMKGKLITNKMGFDCHGLPSEMAMNKKLGLNNNEEVRRFGVGRYIEECQKMIHEYSGSWDQLYRRIGRFSDFKDTYRTMDPEFMESVWWAWKKLWDQKLTYRGVRVMPYSTACNTCLSNFEANQNYQLRTDPSVYVKFPVHGLEETYLIAWTTTPWTLVSNQALCVHPTHSYVRIRDHTSGQEYLCAQEALTNLYPETRKKKNRPEDYYKILQTLTGEELTRYRYVKPFRMLSSEQEGETVLPIVADNFVQIGDPSEGTSTVGTGVVHLAPGFGDEDFWVCERQGLIETTGQGVICPIDEHGCFDAQVPDYLGELWETANPKILNRLKEGGWVVRIEEYTHNYPYCWRTQTPLIYKVVPSFFVAVSQMRERLVEMNRKVHWVPEHVGHHRFHEWISQARDWGVSRNRFFGTPLPVWISDDGEEMRCFGSRAELEEAVGHPLDLTDLHMHHLEFEVPSLEGRGMLKRVPDVFDCWFESGSVPFAQVHYPFEKSDLFDDQEYLCDFIVEGIDQTRGWFYTLTVLSTALFDRPAFQNVICSGLVLAETGKKMSKSLQNYPDPLKLIENYGVDALRLYLLNSPLVRGEPLCFSEKGVRLTLQKLTPWYEGVRFFLDNYQSFRKAGHELTSVESENIFDRWIQSRIGTLVAEIDDQMSRYQIQTIPNHLMEMIEELTNWYIRCNRDRLRGRYNSVDDWHQALATLWRVHLSFTRVMAPFAPFLSDFLFQQLRVLAPEETPSSVILGDYPRPEDYPTDPVVERQIRTLQELSQMVRGIRVRSPNHHSVKMPFEKLTVYSDDPTVHEDLQVMVQYLGGEINVRSVEYQPLGKMVRRELKPNQKNLGIRFRKRNPMVLAQIAELDPDVVESYCRGELESIMITLGGEPHLLGPEELGVVSVSELSPEDPHWSQQKQMLVVVDPTLTPEVQQQYRLNLLAREVQVFRQQLKLTFSDHLVVLVESTDSEWRSVVEDPRLNTRLPTTEVTLDSTGAWEQVQNVKLDNSEVVLRARLQKD